LKIIISGGGTGGHIFPAIAIAKTIQSRKPDAEILFVGAEGKMEMEKVPAAGFKIVGLPIVGIQRRLTLKNLAVPFKLLSSMIKARRILKDFKPDIAIGVGGYASGPLLRAATGKGIKTLIQEQNSYPGITNKILSSKVDRICVAYEGLEKYFPKEKIVITGNPVRPEVTKLEGKLERAQEQFQLDRSKKTILVIGGSLGARTINLAIRRWAEDIVKEGYQLIWQTGKSYIETAQTFVKDHNLKDVHVFEFIREMDLAYAAADIIVSRAGAMSIAELCLVRKPSIFIPSPNVSEDHQTKNAMALVQRNAAVLVKDVDAQNDLKKEILALITNDQKMTQCAANMAALGFPDAAEAIVAEVFALINQKN
jgi:UDP-N-acetylglucosamine--N-acetylmuramyl-(pentapeptide) pyrophosphoryl-undecaprenol N-acetylglucosamine transferase